MDEFGILLRRLDELGRSDSWVGRSLSEDGVDWLRAVAVTAHDLARRPRFRGLAAGTLDALRPGGGSEARRQADDLAAAVRADVVRLEVFSGARRRRPLAARPDRLTTADRVAERYAIADGLLRRLALDLQFDPVEPDEYLAPRARWSYVPTYRHSWEAAAAVSADGPEPPPVGEFVASGLVRRAGMAVRRLNEARSVLVAAAEMQDWRDGLPPAQEPVGLGDPRPARPRQPLADVRRLEEAAGAVATALAQLRAACPPEADSADAAVVLTQVYAGYHRDPDLGWLGLSPYALGFGPEAVRQGGGGPGQAAVLARAAAALRTLRGAFTDGGSTAAAFDEAVAGGGLVVDVAGRSVYWGGDRLAVDWPRHPQCWRLLVALARAVRVRQPVRPEDVFDVEVADSSMGQLANRLRILLPVGLRGQIHPVPPKGYRLDLPADQVHLAG